MILRFFKYMFIMIFALALLVCGAYIYARYIEPNMLTVEEKTIEIDSLPENLDGLRIGLFSDTHISNAFPPDTAFANAIEKLKAQNPDIIFFTGDLFDNMKVFRGDESEAVELLKSLSAPYGKYAVYGNHDYQVNTIKKYKQIMKESGFVLLKNEIAKVDALKMNVIGLDESLLGYGTTDVTKKADNDYFNVVLSHEPDVLLGADENVDLMLSGHSHGGQVNMPFFGPVFLPRLGRTYIDGEYRMNIGDGSEAVIYVTSGIGMSKLPFRFLVPPEIVILTLKK